MRPAQRSEPRHPADEEPTIETSVPTAQLLAQLTRQEDRTPVTPRPPPEAPDSDKTISASSDMIDALTSNARRTDPPPGDAITTALPPMFGQLEQPPPSFGPPPSFPTPFRVTPAPIPYVPLAPVDRDRDRGNGVGARILGGLVAVAYAVLMMKLLWLASGWMFRR